MKIMLNLEFSNNFRKDIKKSIRRGKDLAKMDVVINLLRIETILPDKYRDHLLKGDWSGHRECHIEPDWLLIYKVEGDTLYLIRTGSHADLF